ncbi:LysE/ArgO family amino acid transporter [Chloroflexota bacterium]
MDIGLFFSSVLIGLSIAAPVGPIGVLCIRRTLAEGRLYGLVSGLGAATADAIYGFVAAFGLTLITDVLLSRTALLQLVGGLFLAYLGGRTLFARPAEEAAPSTEVAPSTEGVTVTERRGIGGAYVSTFVLTLTNPMTILAFVGIFAGLGATAVGSYGAAALMVLGVFTGSALWWFLLSGGVSLFWGRLDSGLSKTQLLLWVNRISGVIILIFAAVILGQLIV